MATYRELHGRSIQAVTTDPTGDVAEGQIWYNTTTSAFKTIVVSEAWSSAAPLNTAVYDNAGAGAQDSALNAGGTESPSVARSDNTEEYNGSGWATGGNLNTARFGSGMFGTQTAAYYAGGNTSPGGGTTAATESYNGTSWTSLSSPANLNTPRQNMPASTVGPGSAGLMFGGASGTSILAATEEWNGSAWSEESDLSTARHAVVGAGVQTAAVAVGGYTTTSVVNAEEYNGSSWTSGTNLPAATNGGYRVGNSADDFYYAGGDTPGGRVQTVRRYDGTSWTTTPSMGSINAGSGGSPGISTPSAGIAFGGNNPPPSITTTEEFNKTVNVVTAAAWAAGGNLNTARAYTHGCGLQDAALVVAGYNGSVTTNVEEYDGTSWTEQNNLGTSRYNCGTLGIQTAAFAAGGRTPPPDVGSTTVEAYDGSSWTSAPSLNSARTYLSGVGTTTASLVAMGANPRSSASNLAEEYNGSSWTAVNTNGTTRSSAAAGGVQTSATYFGGTASSTATEEYDGTNWTAGGTLLVSSPNGMLGGSTNSTGYSVLRFAGNPSVAVTEGYDGTSWSTRPSMATARHALAGAGVETAALAAGGSAPPWSNATEEFTGETTSLNVKTLTQS